MTMYRNSLALLLLLAGFPHMLLGQNGIVLGRSFMHDGFMRSYLLYVPAAYDGQEARPLVINYHGHGSSPTNHMNIHSRMNGVADTVHFMIAYPQGLGVEIQGVGTRPGWSVPGLTASHDDVTFSEALIDHVNADYAIDPARIHATGYSNGSVMAFHLACTRPGRIASVSGVAGPMSNLLLASCDPGRRIATLFVHGTSDPIVSFDDGYGDWLPPASTTPAFWAAHNNCVADSVTTELPDTNLWAPDNSPPDSSTVTLIDYGDCDDGAEVLFYRVNNGGHTWPGNGEPNPIHGLGNVNRDIHASVEILNFFARHRHPDPSGPTSIEQDNPEASESGVHLEVYPSPFTEQVTLAFDVAHPAPVTLTLLNVLGQRIDTIARRTMPVGRQHVVWPVSNRRLSSGVYFLRLQIGDEHVTKPVLYSAR